MRALRSGEYKQGAGDLLRNEEFCCLGVLGDLAVKDHITEWQDKGYCNIKSLPHIQAFALLPLDVVTWAGLPKSNPTVIIADKLTPLSQHNDSGQLPIVLLFLDSSFYLFSLSNVLYRAVDKGENLRMAACGGVVI